MHRFFRGGRVLPSLRGSTNQLSSVLKGIMAVKGHISFAEYMEAALCHPQWGYYSRKEAFGRAGDFVTSPEISQTFGEMVGVWCASLYSGFDNPMHWHIVEIGPGRGSLAIDVCRTLRDVGCDKGLNFRRSSRRYNVGLRSRRCRRVCSRCDILHTCFDRKSIGGSFMVVSH